MKTINILSFGMVLLLVAACGPTGNDAGKSSGAAFQLLSEKQSGIRFKNQLSPTYDNNIIEFDYFYNGGGVALGDVNQDGLTDIFFSGNMVSSALYLNKGDLKFEEITDLAGLQTDRWATGVMMTDINADGWLDIYVCFSGLGEGKDRRNSFFINQGLSAEGVPTFVDRAAEMGLADEGYSTQAAFFDYDKDGDLDLYLLTALHDKFNPNFPKKKENNGQSSSTDRLYRNDGITADGLPKFINVSTEAGITYEGYGLGVAINDVNKDGWEDIYVANDFIFDDLLYINQGNGTFKEEAANYTRHSSRFSMGCDLADINNDALVDIMVLDMLPADNHRQKMMSTATSYQKYKLELRNGYRPQYSRNVLQLNMGKAPDGTHAFSDIGYLAGVYKTDWSWAPLLVDFDNDGYRDLFITNGIPKDITNNDYIAYRDNHINPNADYDELKKDFLGYIDCLPDTYFSNYMYRNYGKDDRHAAFSFEDVTKSWGLSGLTCSNGAAYGDLDNDGDLDLVINNVNDRAFLYESKVSDQGNQWLRVQLHGPANNPSGLGSEITLSARGNTQFYHQSVARGFQSCQEATLQFGLGSAKQADSLEVIWPDGKMQRMVTVPAGQVIHLYYKDATVGTPKYVASKAPIFKNVSLSTGIGWAHRENTFDEFDAEFLLPHQYSKQGPGVAVGDVNGDGLDDFVAAGAMGQATTIFIQDNKGKFQERAFDANANREDIGVLLFDADNDSDLDLYVASGGSEFMAGTPPYQDRLYVNDGKGNFTLDQSALPRMFVSTSCVTAADYDQDG
ncbi:MAG: VCBS repeat-containing protein, partial [Phaeodactylibacter sp.]|nr:VCBS repeat-containing protein [Phaeodactylibacter sp.]